MTEQAQWLHLEHEETGGTSQIPNDDAVRTWHEARGWRVVDPPEQVPFIPTPTDQDGEQAAWATLVHPDLDASHDFPNNPDALAGAAQAGWVEPNKDGSVPAPATARRRAKKAVADVGADLRDDAGTWDAAIESARTTGGAAGDSSEQAESSATDQKE
jgi:hypothetical protein